MICSDFKVIVGRNIANSASYRPAFRADRFWTVWFRFIIVKEDK